MIRNVRYRDLFDALDYTNRVFDNNVLFRTLTPSNNNTLDGRGSFQVTLKVKDSRGLGARLTRPRSFKPNSRHILFACWHVHGTFIDALPDKTSIYTTIGGKTVTVHPREEWRDATVGPSASPYYLSELCECECE